MFAGVLIYSTGVNFWKELWADRLRAGTMDSLSQAYFLVTTVLQGFGKLVDLAKVTAWVGSFIHEVFDILTVLAVCALAIPMTWRMCIGAIGAFRTSRPNPVTNRE